MPDTDDAKAAAVWQAILALVFERNDRRKEVSEALDMSYLRAKALRRLAGQPMTMRELAALLQTDAPYMTVVVDDLEKRGLVRREPHPSDRRAKLVIPTDRGRQEAARAERIHGRPPAEMLSLTPAELDELARLLAKLDGQPAG
ncbi:MarR family winged helix-turn-helix transcriptional regulator [Dactylosporangium sp. NPDC051541]|uniref:MarR family winged helix-turn-helix transcriptional regulator n=1 Tax=Dactylosporangium sp. NPDC051541 TaxID=3363977 RepID=UPI0037942018